MVTSKGPVVGAVILLTLLSEFNFNLSFSPYWLNYVNISVFF